MTADESNLRTVLTLDSEIWHEGLTEPAVSRWLEQFDGRSAPSNDVEERSLCLALLAEFMFFGQQEVEVLCQSLYQEHLWYPIAEAYRRANGDTTDVDKIESAVRASLDATAIVGPGNPAESGAHLLYQFRVANELPLKLFTSPFDLEHRDDEELQTITRVVLIDDLCATGGTAEKYFKRLVRPLRERHPHGDDLEVLYLPLLATTDGLASANKMMASRTAMLVDETYATFEASSRYFKPGGRISELGIERVDARDVLEHYGGALFKSSPLGFGDCQLLLGFAHNIPNNTLPVLWSTGGQPPWRPLFPRHGKSWDW